MNETLEPVVLKQIDAPLDPIPAGRRVASIPNQSEFNGELRDKVKKLRIGGESSSSGGGSKGTLIGRVAWLPWILCAALALTWGSLGLRNYQAKAREDVGAKADTGESSSSTKPKAAANEARGAITVEGKGYLIAAKQISVSPIDVGGKVIELRGPPQQVGRPAVAFVEGALYNKNDIIAILDTGSYQPQKEEAIAALNSADKKLIAAQERYNEQLPKAVRKIEFDQVKAQLTEAKATKLRADLELRRQLDLGTSVAQRELQQAQADSATAAARVGNLEATLGILEAGPRKERLLALEADIAGAEADVAAAKARVSQAQWRLDNCTIKAPITGTVLAIPPGFGVGKLVNPMAFSGGGAICDLADLADLEVEFEVSERDIGKLKDGQKCTVCPEAFKDRIYSANLDRIMPIANRANGTFKVRVKVKLFDKEIPGTFLKPEMGAVVTFRDDAPTP